MATEEIGELLTTAIPSLANSADIQEALRIYHYGSESYDPANTSTAALVPDSIAYRLFDLQEQITAVEGGGISESIFTAKGQLISSDAATSALVLSAGSNNQFLIVNSATATGLQWSNNLVSPVVTGLTLNDSSIVFEGSSADEFETTLTVVNPTADRTITLPNTSGNVVIDTASQTLTNKTLTSPVISSITNTGTLTLPTSTDTLVGRATTDTLSNKMISSPKELMTLSATAATGTIQFDALTQGVLYYTSDASGNFTLNFRGNSGTTLDSLMSAGDSWTVAFLCTNGATARYLNSNPTVDTSATVSVKWSGGAAPTSGNSSSIDIYTFTIIKTGSSAFTILAAGPIRYA